MDTTRADMTQAVLEGVAFGLRDSLEVARSLGIKIERTKICGGGAKSPLWKKIIANVMNLKVDIVENEEGPSLGGAMLAAVGCGEYPDVETAAAKIVKVVDTVEPDEELTAKYEERYQKFRKIMMLLMKKLQSLINIIKMGRTQMQDAVPIRLGQEFKAYSVAIMRDIHRMDKAMDEMRYS